MSGLSALGALVSNESDSPLAQSFGSPQMLSSASPDRRNFQRNKPPSWLTTLRKWDQELAETERSADTPEPTAKVPNHSLPSFNSLVSLKKEGVDQMQNDSLATVQERSGPHNGEMHGRNNDALNSPSFSFFAREDDCQGTWQNHLPEKPEKAGLQEDFREAPLPLSKSSKTVFVSSPTSMTSAEGLPDPATMETSPSEQQTLYSSQNQVRDPATGSYNTGTAMSLGSMPSKGPTRTARLALETGNPGEKETKVPAPTASRQPRRLSGSVQSRGSSLSASPTEQVGRDPSFPLIPSNDEIAGREPTAAMWALEQELNSLEYSKSISYSASIRAPSPGLRPVQNLSPQTNDTPDCTSPVQPLPSRTLPTTSSTSQTATPPSSPRKEQRAAMLVQLKALSTEMQSMHLLNDELHTANTDLAEQLTHMNQERDTWLERYRELYAHAHRNGILSAEDDTFPPPPAARNMRSRPDTQGFSKTLDELDELDELLQHDVLMGKTPSWEGSEGPRKRVFSSASAAGTERTRLGASENRGVSERSRHTEGRGDVHAPENLLGLTLPLYGELTEPPPRSPALTYSPTLRNDHVSSPQSSQNGPANTWGTRAGEVKVQRQVAQEQAQNEAVTEAKSTKKISATKPCNPAALSGRSKTPPLNRSQSKTHRAPSLERKMTISTQSSTPNSSAGPMTPNDFLIEQTMAGGVSTSIGTGPKADPNTAHRLPSFPPLPSLSPLPPAPSLSLDVSSKKMSKWDLNHSPELLGKVADVTTSEQSLRTFLASQTKDLVECVTALLGVLRTAHPTAQTVHSVGPTLHNIVGIVQAVSHVMQQYTEQHSNLTCASSKGHLQPSPVSESRQVQESNERKHKGGLQTRDGTNAVYESDLNGPATVLRQIWDQWLAHANSQQAYDALNKPALAKACWALAKVLKSLDRKLIPLARSQA